MSWQDYLAALYGGQTGTDDPSAGGFSFPSLIGSAQAAEPPMPARPMPFGGAPNVSPDEIARLLQSQQPSAQPPAGGDPSMMHGGAPTYSPPSVSSMFQGAFGRTPSQAIQNGLFGSVPPPPIPGPFTQDQAAPAPAGAPRPDPQRGGAQILARLSNPQPMQAPGGGSMADAGVSTLGPPPPGSPYAMLQDAARRAQMAGQPAPPPIPPPFQQQPQAAPQAAPAAAPSQLGGRTQAWADKISNSPLTNYSPLKVDKPTIWDNLTRFGLAAMAAGGKPMATTLGALGEAGLSTVDQNRKQEQSNVENELKNRQVGIQGQGILAKAYEIVDGLEQRSHDRTLSVAAQQQTAHDAQALRAAIATGNQQLVQQKLEEIARHDREMEATAQEKAGDRRDAESRHAQDAAAKQAEQNQRDAATSYDRRRTAMEKNAPMGSLSEQQEAQLLSQTARNYPNSNYAREWATTKQGYLDTVRRGLQAYPNDQAKRKQAIDRLHSMGINPSEL